MDKMRCVLCGSSRVGSDGLNCGRCGAGALALRSEKCHIHNDTKIKLLTNAKAMAEYGVEIRQERALEKRISAFEAMGAISVALQLVDGVRGRSTLRDLVLFLRKLSISEQEVLALRLDEPEQILTYYRMDKDDKDRAD